MVLDICAMLVLLVCAYENWSYCILLQALRETNISSEWLIVKNHYFLGTKLALSLIKVSLERWIA